MRRGPVITAHSGCMGTEPNSRAHIEAAIREGAEIVELDIRLTADGRVVLSHDETVPDPASGGRGAPVPGRDATEGGTMVPVGATSPLELEEAFELLSGNPVAINLDVKEFGAALASAAIIRKRGMEDRVVFSGLDEAATALMRDRLPRFRYLLNPGVLMGKGSYGVDEVREACRIAAENGCCGLNLDYRAAEPLLMEYTRRRLLPVVLWTVDTEEDLRAVLDLCPFSVTTNRPDLLARMEER